MSVFNLYSKQRKASKSRRKQYRYDLFPEVLRNQVLGIFQKVIGRGSLVTPNGAYEIYDEVERILCQEYGIRTLDTKDDNWATALTAGGTVRRFFQSATVDQCLDVIQVTMTVAKQLLERPQVVRRADQIPVQQGVDELNFRFREHGLGFQLHDGHIVKLTSGITHEFATRPVLRLLQQPFLAGANQEYLSAHEHFRHGRYKECLNDCSKSFESTMKAICEKRGWQYQETDTAKPLVRICVENKLFPVFLENHLTGLRMTLESGVPTARNKTSAHGQGSAVKMVSGEFATYVLNLTAANILFLADSERMLP